MIGSSERLQAPAGSSCEIVTQGCSVIWPPNFTPCCLPHVFICCELSGLPDQHFDSSCTFTFSQTLVLVLLISQRLFLRVRKREDWHGCSPAGRQPLQISFYYVLFINVDTGP